MKHKEVAELIDQFLRGRIQSEDLARLEYLRKTDPEIDLEVQESLKTYEVIKYLRYKQLRQKLQEVDRSYTEKNKSFNNRYWIFALILLTACVLCFWIWGYRYYAPESISMRLFIHSSGSFASFYEMNNEDVIDWNLAITTFNEKKFEEAIIRFQPFLLNHSPDISISARWGILLAQFALQGDKEEWNKAMIQFQSEAPEPFKSASVKLLHTIDSPFYSFFVCGLAPKFSALKPRIM